jgi:glycerophosphoryl diester phosphodiesterase
MRLVGHKGADSIAPGNTVESFAAAVEAGADTIELDVLWLEDGSPKLPAERRSPLVIAHDWLDAGGREILTLDEALEAFTRPPLVSVELDCDLKLPGREDELAAALRRHGLIERAMVSTMSRTSLARLRDLEPSLRRGWTYPKIKRDWGAIWWAKPGVWTAVAVMRARLPRLATRELPRLGVDSMWVFHPLITRRLALATRAAGIELIAWTVDDLARMRRLVALGVDGICSNDPRLFAQLEPHAARSFPRAPAS